jgi:hypothetical protein
VEWSGVDKADPTHFTTATSQVVNQGPKDPRKKLNHTCVAGGIGELAMPAPEDLFGIVALEVAVALRLMKHDENGHELTWAEACATLAKMTRPKKQIVWRLNIEITVEIVKIAIDGRQIHGSLLGWG